jgi:xylan 1,4-beta-xylosidase
MGYRLDNIAYMKNFFLAPFLLCVTQAALAQGVIPPSPAASAENPAIITVDLSSKVGPYKPIYSWFGYDEANYTTMRNGKVLLRSTSGRTTFSLPVMARPN